MRASDHRNFIEMGSMFGVSNKIAYLAVRRYALEANLLKLKSSDDDDDAEDGDFTLFGNIPLGTEKTVVELFEDIFFDDSANRLKTIHEFNSDLVALLFQEIRKPCCWGFGRLHKNGDELNINAICLNSGCKCSVSIITENERKTLVIRAANYNSNVPHTKSRYTTSETEKSKLIELLKFEAAMTVHATLANDYIASDHIYPAHLPSTEVLRKIKSRAKQCDSQIRDQNAIVSIQKMKHEPAYSEIIHRIGADPFFVIWSVPLQKECIQDDLKHHSGIFAIDATGISIQPPIHSSISETTGKYKRAYMYLITFQGSANVPVFQSISQDHSHEFICDFLLHWKNRQLNGKMPAEMIMDNSAALLLASVLVFTGSKSLREYLSHCYDCLFEYREKPFCYIRIDRAHFVKSIMRNKKIKREDKRRCQFYQRILGSLILCDDIKKVEKTIRQLFVVINNQYLFDEYVKEAKKDLFILIATHRIDADSSCDDDENEIADSYNDEDSKFAQWVKSLAEEVRNKYVNHDLNQNGPPSGKEDEYIENYYATDKLQPEIIRILSKLPLFSNIMNGIFDSSNMTATTAYTEVRFHHIKNYIFTKSKMRLDLWLTKSIQETKGSFLSAMAKKKTSSGLTGQTEKAKRSKTRDPVLLENWRGIASEDKKRTIVKRTKTSILQPSSTQPKPVPLMVNGGMSSTSGRNARKIKSVNTCGFDAIYHIVATAYVDSPNFAAQINNADDLSDLAKFIRTSLTAGSKQIIQSRNDLLMKLMGSVAVNVDSRVLLDCWVAIDVFYGEIVQNCPVMNSLIRTVTCKTCIISNTDNMAASMPYHAPNGFPVDDISSVICLKKNLLPCTNCGGERENNFEAGDLVAFDIGGLACDLNDIQRELHIAEANYVLHGLIKYVPGHFVSYILRGKSWEVYDDKLPKVVSKNNEQNVKPAFIFYLKKD